MTVSYIGALIKENHEGYGSRKIASIPLSNAGGGYRGRKIVYIPQPRAEGGYRGRKIVYIPLP